MTPRGARPRVLLADDHRIVCDGLKGILAPEFEVVGAVENGRQLIEAAGRLRPDVIVADISMPLLNGLDAMIRILADGPPVKVVLLTGMPDVALATRAIRCGASGYVLKASAGEELVTALHEALAGRTFITARISDEVFQSVMEGRGKAREAVDELTAREREVLQLLAEGKSIKEAAAVLNISPRTIEFHKANVQDKTGLHSTAELARHAVRLGLVSG